ncbi:hypothetical protein vseg_002246 [Gypsophila vaccaria]
MSYSQVSHVAHDSYPPQGGPWAGAGPGPGPGPAPPPPPPPRPTSYQGYLRQDYPALAPAVAHMPYGSSYEYSYDNPCSSLFRACVAAVCCCCIMDECCPQPRW